MTTPEILPQNHQLDFLIDDNYSEIANMLADIYEEHGSFVDVDLEEQYPTIMTIIEKIAISYLGDDDVGDDVYSALYQSFFFAYTTARSVTRTDISGIAVSNYYGQSTEELFTTMMSDSEEFLDSRPAINGLLYAFMGSIDTSQHHTEAARAVAAVTFKRIEDDARTQFIATTLQEFDKELSVGDTRI